MKEKDEIEKLFEKRLSGKYFVFREADWQKMEEKLDASPANISFFQTPGGRGLIITTAIIIIFLMGWFSNDLMDTTKTSNLDNSEIITQTSDPQLNNSQDRDTELKAPVKQENTGNRSNVAGKADNSGDIRSVRPKIENTQVGADTYAADNKKDIPGEEGQQKQIKRQHELNSGDNSANISRESLLLEANEETAADINNNTPALRKTMTINKVKVINNPLLPEDSLLKEDGILQPVTMKEEAAKQENDISRWSVGVVYAPDLTSAGFGNDRQLAQAFGAQVNYHFNRKWSLQSGIHYVKKKYEALPEDYLPYENYWDYKMKGYVPDEIDGNCGVIDIPINIVRTWKPGRRLSFLTGIGISNYIILNEEYTYRYTGYYKYEYTYESYDNSKIMAGIINISAGISWKVNDRIHLQVEPYLKVPIEKIGYGNLNLFTTGTFFTIRHRL